MVAITTLKVRKDFLKAAQGFKASGQFLSLQMAQHRVPRPAPHSEPVMAFGVTASKKVGNSVARSRAKRRLRAAMMALLPVHGRAGFDYVTVARTATIGAPWPALLDDLSRLFIRLQHKVDAASPVEAGQPIHNTRSPSAPSPLSEPETASYITDH